MSSSISTWRCDSGSLRLMEAWAWRERCCGCRMRRVRAAARLVNPASFRLCQKSDNRHYVKRYQWPTSLPVHADGLGGNLQRFATRELAGITAADLWISGLRLMVNCGTVICARHCVTPRLAEMQPRLVSRLKDAGSQMCPRQRPADNPCDGQRIKSIAFALQALPVSSIVRNTHAGQVRASHSDC